MIEAAIYGRLGRDPETRTTRSGKPMATASVAVDVTPHGSDEPDSLWVSVAAFGRTAEQLARHHKGDLVAFMGRLTRSRWTDRDGNEREGWQLTAQTCISARTVRPGGGRRRKAVAGDGEAFGEALTL